jgi:hypothetical protein
MADPRDEPLIKLRTAWPAWEIWYVPRVVGVTWWCARLRDNHARLLHGNSPAELAEYLAEASSGQTGHATEHDTGGRYLP